ncbi:MAG: GNAT family N-acetyltransferase [Marinilabiliaceae bacterium]|nr:GNAT family N-acetyltransferase [Marinilabiliaceae bacterium]
MNSTIAYKLRDWNDTDLNDLVKYANNRNIAKWLTNLQSQRVLKKAGFVFESKLKNALFKNGEFIDELIYAKLKE